MTKLTNFMHLNMGCIFAIVGQNHTAMCWRGFNLWLFIDITGKENDDAYHNQGKTNEEKYQPSKTRIFMFAMSSFCHASSKKLITTQTIQDNAKNSILILLNHITSL